MMNFRWAILLLIIPLVITPVFIGCDDDDDSDNRYQVSVLNITNNQPFSPVAVVFQSGSEKFWDGASGGDHRR